MNDPAQGPRPDRPALPHDAFRTQRSAVAGSAVAETRPVVVTPDYDRDDAASLMAAIPEDTPKAGRDRAPSSRRKPNDGGDARPRNPLGAYGERSSSRPYALRLPDPIDLALRQIAAEERTHPLRIVDRLIHDHLRRLGRLPPPRDGT